ncbi:MAG: hypothetical protein M5U27_02405 [Gaiella sp.]|nr:hypothetical protein [Gaiella sp.]
MAVRPPLRLLRLGNPVVRSILRSPAHRLLSGSLAVLEYEGRTTGRRFAIPLRYAETHDGRLVAIAVPPDRKLWWRSFEEPRDARLELRGHAVRIVGRLAEGGARDEASAAYATRFPRSARLLEDAAVVVFERGG